MNPTRTLFRAARLSADLGAITSGKPKRFTRRAKNQVVGRALARGGIWRRAMEVTSAWSLELLAALEQMGARADAAIAAKEAPLRAPDISEPEAAFLAYLKDTGPGKPNHRPDFDVAVMVTMGTFRLALGLWHWLNALDEERKAGNLSPVREDLLSPTGLALLHVLQLYIDEQSSPPAPA